MYLSWNCIDDINSFLGWISSENTALWAALPTALPVMGCYAHAVSALKGIIILAAICGRNRNPHGASTPPSAL